MITPPVNSLRWLKAGLLVPLVVLNAWVIIQIFQYLEPLLTIFIAASVLAFVLNYPVEFLQRKIARNYAVLLVLLVSVVGLVTLGVTLVPALLEQLSAILSQLPDWFNSAIAKLQTVQNWASAHRIPINLNRLIRQFTERLPDQLEGLGDQTVLLTLNAVNALTSLLLTLVLTFYLLLDGKRVWNAVFQRLPLQNRERIRRSLQNDFHGYFIGQATLGVIMGVLLSIVLVVLRVPYSLLLGSTVGLMTLIPFGDVLGYSVVCLLIAAQSPALAVTVLLVVFVLDQIVDQAIAPRILGSFTGLKPLWVIVSLLLGTKLFGLPGLLLAVPAASFINTLLDDDSLLQTEDPPQPLETSASENGKDESALMQRSQAGAD
ncbi:MAG: AI-2E family transporter [Oscillatoriales cyanobacterium C42_A2020_001]|nr:AI-2E family transporter [Leptolyngbyaceae cyanobacterium C42_A2020_001]